MMTKLTFCPRSICFVRLGAPTALVRCFFCFFFPAEVPESRTLLLSCVDPRRIRQRRAERDRVEKKGEGRLEKERQNRRDRQLKGIASKQCLFRVFWAISQALSRRLQRPVGVATPSIACSEPWTTGRTCGFKYTHTTQVDRKATVSPGGGNCVG